jgi:alpha-L-fucosidase
VARIVSTLTDVVSKNGNLMLNIPLRGDGSIDDCEEAFLAGFTAWMDVNSEGIYGTRPWKVYGEGPSTAPRPPAAPGSGRGPAPPWTSEDIRFTTKAGALYTFVGAWPESRVAKIRSLAAGSPQLSGAKVANVSLLGYGGKVTWTHDEQGLSVTLPDRAPSRYAVTMKIQGVL